MQADHMGDSGADGRIIELILSNDDGSMRIGLNWLRTGTSNEPSGGKFLNWLQDHLLLQNPAPCGQSVLGFYTSLELYSSHLLL